MKTYSNFRIRYESDTPTNNILFSIRAYINYYFEVIFIKIQVAKVKEGRLSTVNLAQKITDKYLTIIIFYVSAYY